MKHLVVLVAILASIAVTVSGQKEPPPNVVYSPVGISAPTVIKEVAPIYPTQARLDRIQGVALLEVVVAADGSVADAKIVRGLDPMLNAEAVKAMKQWQFKPAAKDGKPIGVMIFVELTFALKR